MLNLNDLIEINKKFSEGKLKDKNSIEFALSVRQRKPLINLAHIIRALLIDHVFIDGNKRTATYIIIEYFGGWNLDKDKLAYYILKIVNENITDLEEIKECLIKSLRR